MTKHYITQAKNNNEWQVPTPFIDRQLQTISGNPWRPLSRELAKYNK